MYLVLFSLTIFMILQTDIYYQNITFLSYQNDTYLLYVCYGMIMTSFLYYKITRLYLNFSFLNKKNLIIINTIFLAMILSLLIPYHPGTSDLTSSMHVVLIGVSGIGILWLEKNILFQGNKINQAIFHPLNVLFDQIMICFIILVVYFGSVNSIAECFYIGWVLFILYKTERISLI